MYIIIFSDFTCKIMLDRYTISVIDILKNGKHEQKVGIIVVIKVGKNINFDSP